MPKDAPCRVADSNDLCIEVRSAGAKAWRYCHAGKPGIVTVGEYPAMSLMQARSERDKLRVLLKAGANSAHVVRAERAIQAGRANSTFGAIQNLKVAPRLKYRPRTSSNPML
jgi:hypothetical protein